MTEQLDVRARLTADDDASPVIRRLLSQISALEKKINSSFAKNKISSSIIDPKVQKYLEKTGGTLDALTPKYMRWARAQRDAGQMSADSWNRITQSINEHAKAFERSGKMTAKQRQDTRNLVRQASAFKAVWNQAYNERVRSEEKMHDQIGRLEEASTKRRMRAEREEHSQRERHHRSHMRNLRYVAGAPGRMMNRLDGNGFFNSPTFYAMAGGALAGKAAQSSVSTRMRIDDAETNARIFGGMSKEQIASMRSSFGDKASIKYGMNPADLLESYTEVLKAGIPEKVASEFTDAILKGAIGIDLSTIDTTKLVARAASLTGDLENLDPAKVKSMMNAIAIANNVTAASGNEIVAANRRGTGVLSSSKMTMEQLSAFTAAGISGGMQSAKAGTFMDFLVNDLVNAKNTKGERRLQLNKFGNMLGMGGGAGLSAAMGQNPTQTIVSILDKMGAMSEGDRAKAGNLLGMREWRGELGILVQGRAKVKEILEKITDPKNANFLDEASEQKVSNLTGRWKSFKSALLLAWEAVGKGFDDVFVEVTGSLTDILGKLDRSAIAGHIRGAMQGVLSGLGFNTWKDAIESLIGKPGASFDKVQTVTKFAKGLAAGFKEVASTIATVVVGFAKAFGVNTADPEAMGKFVAKIVGFTVALHFMRPVLSVFGLFIDILKVFTTLAFAGPIALITALSGLLTALNSAGTKTPADAKKRLEEYKSGAKQVPERSWLNKFLLGPKRDEPGGMYDRRSTEEQARLFKKVAFDSNETKSSIDDLRDQLKSVGADIKLASYSGATEFSARRRSGTSMSDLGFGGGGSGYSSSIGSPSDLLKSVPGTALPSFGMGSRGIIGGSSGGGGSGRRSGSGSFVAPSPGGNTSPNRFNQIPGGFGRKAPAVMNQLMKDFGFTKEQAAGIVGNLGHESSGLQAINEAKPLIPGSRGGFGWAQWTGPRRRQFEAWAKAKGLDIKSDEANYGFLKHELMTTEKGAVAAVKRQNSMSGATTAFEQSYERAGIKHYGSRFKWGQRALDAHGNNPTANVPESGQSVINKVPPGQSGGGHSLMPQAMNGGGAQIHINGGGHDPESLALLVQRRIDESMNWRSHDIESEMA